MAGVYGEGESWEMPWMTLDEAREAGVPEEVIQAALMEADEKIFGLAVAKKDPETGIWMRVYPPDVKFVASLKTTT